jgi:hypothetical protein
MSVSGLEGVRERERGLWCAVWKKLLKVHEKVPPTAFHMKTATELLRVAA